MSLNFSSNSLSFTNKASSFSPNKQSVVTPNTSAIFFNEIADAGGYSKWIENNKDGEKLLDLIAKKEKGAPLNAEEKALFNTLYDKFYVTIDPIIIRSTKGVNSQQVQKLKEFYPPINPDDVGLKNIEYVFDFKKKDFATGRPHLDDDFSGHEKLSELLEDNFNEYGRMGEWENGRQL